MAAPSTQSLHALFNNMILAILLSFILGLITGLLVMRKHAAKASELEAKGKAALDALKGR